MKAMVREIASYFQNLFKILLDKPSPESQDFFCDRHPPQSETEFLAICFQSPSPAQGKTALAIRAAIAKLGEVDPKFIRAELCFEELDPLPFWYLCGDAGFDTGEFVDAIELELGCHFTPKQLKSAKVRDPDLNVQMKVHEFINEFSHWYKSLS